MITYIIYSTAALLALNPPYLLHVLALHLRELATESLTRPVPACVNLSFTGSGASHHHALVTCCCKDGQLVLGIYSISVTSITVFFFELTSITELCRFSL